jgi:hypothetical protein
VRRTRLVGRGFQAIAVAVVVLLLGAGVAFADNIEDDIVSTPAVRTITAGESTDVKIWIDANSAGGNSFQGCDAADGSSATITINKPAAVSVSGTNLMPDNRLVFTECGSTSSGFETVTYSSSTRGEHSITLSVSDTAGRYNADNAAFKLVVKAQCEDGRDNDSDGKTDYPNDPGCESVSDNSESPDPVSNTAPSVSVAGFADGDSFEIGDEPQVSCEVSDAEDTNESANPVVDRSALVHGMGTVTVSCSYTDGGGLSDSDSKSYTVVDTTKPLISHSLNPSGGSNSNGWYKDDVTVTFSCSDNPGSGIKSCVADGESGASKTLGEGANQVVSGTATDNAGNIETNETASISIDKTKPSVSLVGGPQDGATYYFGSVPTAPTCQASDALSGLDGGCAVSGYGNTVGPHTVKTSAKDKAGNEDSVEAKYTVLAWSLNGFYQPVDMGMWNTVKGGSTVPLKFEVFAGQTELTSTSAIKSFTTKSVTCPGASAPTDEIEFVTTGGTNLRYDTTAGQFVQNWQTPKKPATCHTVTMTTQDGSTISANFMLK